MNTATGTAFALAAYGLWGVMPAYWKQLAPIPAAELTAWRALCSAAFGVLLLLLWRRSHELVRALRSARDALPIALSAALLGANWLVFIRDWKRYHPRRAAIDARAFPGPAHTVRDR